MSKRKKGSGHYTLPGTRRGPGAYLFWLLLTLGLCYAAAHLLGRTEGARALVLASIGEQLGMECSADGMQPAWNLDLVVEGFHALDRDLPEQTHAQARSIRLRWRPAWRRPGAAWITGILLDDAVIRLAPDGEGQWRPEVLKEWVHTLAGWVQAVEPAGVAGWEPSPVVPAEEGPRGPWRGRTTTVRWDDGQGNETARWEIAEWLVEPVRLSRGPRLLYIVHAAAPDLQTSANGSEPVAREILILGAKRWEPGTGTARPASTRE